METNDYKVQLEIFEGPHNLLLYLIKAEHLVSLPEMLEDDQFPVTERLVKAVTGLRAVTDSKGGRGVTRSTGQHIFRSFFPVPNHVYFVVFFSIL